MVGSEIEELGLVLIIVVLVFNEVENFFSVVEVVEFYVLVFF